MSSSTSSTNLIPLSSSSGGDESDIEAQKKQRSSSSSSSLFSVIFPLLSPRSKTSTQSPPILSSTIRTLRTWAENDIQKGLYLSLTMYFLTFATGMQNHATEILFDGFASNYSGDLIRGTDNAVYAVMGKRVSCWFPDWKLFTFWTCCVVFGQVAHVAGPRRKGYVCLVAGIQAWVMLCGAVVLAALGRSLRVFVLVSLCIGGTAQIVMTRTLDREITTALFTGPTLDMLAHKDLKGFWRTPRRFPEIYKRAFMLLAAVAGDVVGAATSGRLSPEKLLVVACSLRIVVVVALAMAPTDDKRKGQGNKLAMVDRKITPK